jgi:hypothetical protein
MAQNQVMPLIGSPYLHRLREVINTRYFNYLIFLRYYCFFFFFLRNVNCKKHGCFPCRAAVDITSFIFETREWKSVGQGI